MELDNININQVQNFSFEGMVFDSKIIKVIDGDTIKGIVIYNNKPYKMVFRLCGIDTCEIKDKNPIKKDLAIKAKNRVQELIQGNVKVHCKKFDKYGRTMAEVYANNHNISINNILIQEKLAVEYNGRKQTIWDNIIQNHTDNIQQPVSTNIQSSTNE